MEFLRHGGDRHSDVALAACDNLMLRDHVKRCIATVLRLGGCRHTSPANLEPPEIDVRKDEIAMLSNVARNTAGIVLGRLEAAGLIEQSYRRISILAPDELRAMLTDAARMTVS
jgi:CRP-like cAMP-binding protein